MKLFLVDYWARFAVESLKKSMTKLSLFHAQNQKIISEHLDELSLGNTDWQAAADAVRTRIRFLFIKFIRLSKKLLQLHENPSTKCRTCPRTFTTCLNHPYHQPLLPPLLLQLQSREVRELTVELILDLFRYVFDSKSKRRLKRFWQKNLHNHFLSFHCSFSKYQ